MQKWGQEAKIQKKFSSDRFLKEKIKKEASS